MRSTTTKMMPLPTGHTWITHLKEAGYDPAKVRDATDALSVKIEWCDMSGARVGIPTDCQGARAIVREAGALWAYVGAKVVIVVYSKSDIRRYHTDGSIPKNQDRGIVLPFGTPLRLSPPSASEQLGAKRASKSGVRTGTHPKRGRRGGAVLSNAAVLRRVAPCASGG